MTLHLNSSRGTFIHAYKTRPGEGGQVHQPHKKHRLPAHSSKGHRLCISEATHTWRYSRGGTHVCQDLKEGGKGQGQGPHSLGPVGPPGHSVEHGKP